jgi:hypothetical protein
VPSAADGQSTLGGSGKVAEIASASNAVAQTNDLEGEGVLEKLGLWLHSKLLILICRGCQVGLTSQTAMGHLRQQHEYRATADDKEELSALCASRGVPEKAEEVQVPRACGPPVQGIAPPQPGLSCTADTACEYSVRDLQTMLKHCRDKHGQGLLKNSSYRESTVQAIFQSVGRIFFEVDATVTPTSDLDLRKHLRDAFLPGAVVDPVVGPNSEHDRPPLWKITMWDHFEPEIRKDAEQRKAARLLRGKHSEAEQGGIFVSLEKAARGHHALARSVLANSSHSFTLAKVMLSGPDFSPEQ